MKTENVSTVVTGNVTFEFVPNILLQVGEQITKIKEGSYFIAKFTI